MFNPRWISFLALVFWCLPVQKPAGPAEPGSVFTFPKENPWENHRLQSLAQPEGSKSCDIFWANYSDLFSPVGKTPNGGDCKGISPKSPKNSGLGIIVICPEYIPKQGDLKHFIYSFSLTNPENPHEKKSGESFSGRKKNTPWVTPNLEG